MAIGAYILAAFVLAGVLASQVSTVRAQELLVFAAASLKNALDEVVAIHRTRTGTGVSVSYAGSAALAKQIENGAPAGLFVSASTDWMDYLEARQAIRPETRIDLLGNRLVLIAPVRTAISVDPVPGLPLRRMIGDGRLAMADPDAVPAGMYGRAALVSLGVWQEVEDRVAAAENVRAALALVSRGEAPLGIVYATDAKADPGVRVVATFPAATHPPIIYPAAVTRSAPHPAGAAALLEFLHSAEAAAIFTKHGFAAMAGTD